MRFNKATTETVPFNTTAYSTAVAIKEDSSTGFFLSNTVAASTADTFVDADVHVVNNTITLTAHGWLTGRKVAATTGGVLPGGLSATDYYVIKMDANTIKLAASLANALAGTAEDITSAAGGGTHTLTPAALATANYTLQISPDEGITFYDIGSATNITATGTNYEKHEALPGTHVRVKFTAAAGQVSTALTIVNKGN